MKCLGTIDMQENFMKLWIIETTTRDNSIRLCQLQPQVQNHFILATKMIRKILKKVQWSFQIL